MPKSDGVINVMSNVANGLLSRAGSAGYSGKSDVGSGQLLSQLGSGSLMNQLGNGQMMSQIGSGQVLGQLGSGDLVSQLGNGQVLSQLGGDKVMSQVQGRLENGPLASAVKSAVDTQVSTGQDAVSQAVQRINDVATGKGPIASALTGEAGERIMSGSAAGDQLSMALESYISSAQSTSAVVKKFMEVRGAFLV